jgi:enediyne biosynthesis protein E4
MGRERCVILIVFLILICPPFLVDLVAQDSHSATQPSNTSAGQTAKAESSPRIFFRDVAAEAGVETSPNTRLDRRYVLETTGGGGIALFDCDNDGKLDLAVVNDSTIEQYRNGGDLMVTLYHQDGNASAVHFTDVTKTSGLTARGWGMAIAIGDYDNDGLRTCM